MGYSESDLSAALMQLARGSRLISITELCAVMGYTEDQCEEMLLAFIADGRARRTQSTIGQTFYWLNEPPVVIEVKPLTTQF